MIDGRRHLGLLFGAAVLACGACSGGGGTLPGQEGEQGTAIGEVRRIDPLPRVDLPGRISVLIQVVSGEGAPVADLQADDFQLFEDGVAVSSFESSQRLLPRPQDFRSYSLLLLDRSNSISISPEARQQEVDAAVSYIEEVLQTEQYYIALAWFDGQAGIKFVRRDDGAPIGFTNDRDTLLEGANNLHAETIASVSTNLYGAVVDALGQLRLADILAEAEGVNYRALTLVTFTDGTDRAGLKTLEQAEAEIERFGYETFTIGLGNEIERDVLGRLGRSGSVFADRLEDLVPRFQEIARDVRDFANSFYFLSYCSPKQDGSPPHTLTVRAVGPSSSAEQDYAFSSDYFSGGCGFLDVVAPGTPRFTVVVTDLVEDAQGRVVVSGSTVDALFGLAGRLTVQRFDVDGRPDTSFGVGGELSLTNFAGYNALSANALVVDVDGTLVVGGEVAPAQLGASSRLALWRVDERGAVIDSHVGAALDTALTDLALDGAGRLVACGRAGPPGAPATGVWRFGADLEPDLAFATDGAFTHTNVDGFAFDGAVALALFPDDSIVTVGAGLHPATGFPDLKLTRLTNAGALDASFVSGDPLLDDGVVMNLSVLGPLAGAATDVAVDSQQRILVGGTTLDPAAQGVVRAAMWRFLANGAPDPGFAGSPASTSFATGLVQLPSELTSNPRIAFGASRVGIEKLALRPDDSVLATGHRMNAQGHQDLVVWHFGANGRLVPGFNGTGYLIEDGSLIDDGMERGDAVVVHSDGRVWIAGTSAPQVATGPGTRFALWLDDEPARVFQPTGQNP